MEGPLVYSVALLGPTRVGKTTLVTSILRESQRRLSGSTVSIRPKDGPTAERIRTQENQLNASLAFGEFDPGGLAGTQSPFIYRLQLDPGISEDHCIDIEILDFPGGWLSYENRVGHEAEWEACRNFLINSHVLVIPVDAAVLMEATTAQELAAAYNLLRVSTIYDITYDWAKAMAREKFAPSVLLVPVKCESYFTDNGGLVDKEDELAKRTLEAFDHLVSMVEHEIERVHIRYLPVDTIGCVDLNYAQWYGEGEGEVAPRRFVASYRVRPPGKVSLVGVETILGALCRLFLAEKAQSLEGEVSTAEEAAESATKKLENRGVGQKVVDWITGRDDELAAAAKKASAEAVEAHELWRSFKVQLERLAEHEKGPRMRSIREPRAKEAV